MSEGIEVAVFGVVVVVVVVVDAVVGVMVKVVEVIRVFVAVVDVVVVVVVVAVVDGIVEVDVNSFVVKAVVEGEEVLGKCDGGEEIFKKMHWW